MRIRFLPVCISFLLIVMQIKLLYIFDRIRSCSPRMSYLVLEKPFNHCRITRFSACRSIQRAR